MAHTCYYATVQHQATRRRFAYTHLTNLLYTVGCQWDGLRARRSICGGVLNRRKARAVHSGLARLGLQYAVQQQHMVEQAVLRRWLTSQDAYLSTLGGGTVLCVLSLRAPCTEKSSKDPIIQ